MPLPTVVGPAGLVPQAPANVRAQIVAGAAVMSPGLTTNLPGTLIEDVVSTDVAAVVLCDAARVETVDSVTPLGANDYLLNALGTIYGVPVALATNTSVAVVFTGSGGPAQTGGPGYLVPPGFQVSDGTYAYVVQDGGVVQASGQTAPLSCLALSPGTWAVPSGTVTMLATAVPDGVALTCANPLPGVPGAAAETATDYRIRVLQAGLAAGVGMPSYLKTQVQNVPGVQPRLVSVQQQVGGGWKVLVGGGDAYAVAAAILAGVTDVSTLVGSTLAVANVTSAPNGVVTTALNHGYADGQVVVINGVTSGMTAINGVPLTVRVLDEKRFATGVATTLLGAYTSGGVLTPNNRNNAVSIADYPDVYTIPFVSPPAQLVAITVTWNTSATNYVNSGAVAQLAAPALAAYVNGIVVGQPLNLYDLEGTFRTAVASVLSRPLVTRLAFAVSINGVGTAPATGEGVIFGDPESFFLTDPNGADITVNQG